MAVHCRQAPPATLAELVHVERAELMRFAGRAFPKFDDAQLEDALSDVVLQLVERGQLDERASEDWRRALRTRIWRRLRGQWRSGEVRSRHATQTLARRSLSVAPTFEPADWERISSHLRRGEARRVAEVLYQLAAQETELASLVERLVVDVAGSAQWVMDALRAHVRGCGLVSIAELARDHGGHLKSARSILSRKISTFEARLQEEGVGWLRGAM